MLRNIGAYLKEGLRFWALEISETAGEESYFLLKLKRNRDELVITETLQLDTLDGLAALPHRGQPLFLCINTTKIVTKRVEGPPNKNPEATINLAFPNLELNSFYYEVMPQKADCMVSITKKEYVHGLLDRLHEMKTPLYRISLGISAIQNILPFMEEGTISVSNRELVHETGAIHTISTISEQSRSRYRVNGLDLTNPFLLGFSLILGYLGKKKYITNFEPICEGLQWEAKNKFLFDTGLKLALGFFVVLLLGNFLVYDFYHDKVNALNTSMEANSSQKEELTLMAEDVRKKQDRMETLGSSLNSKATYYLDRIAQRMPSTLLLDQMKYQPLAKPLREKKPIVLEERILWVSGISKSVGDFSQWIAELEKYPWIRSVETLDYDYISKSSSHFALEIQCYEDQ
ncbi:MAG: hypothetical protein AAGA86_14540 [Bacteroidota bacterium]